MIGSSAGRRAGVASRLVIALSIPLVLLIIATTQLSLHALRASERASDVDDVVTRLQPLVDLNAAIFDERLAVEAVFGSGTSPQLSQQVQPSLALVREATDAAIAKIDQPPIDLAGLGRNREVQDRNRVLTVFPGRYEPIADDVDDAIRTQVAAAAELAQTFDAQPLQRSVETTEATLDVSSAAFDTVVQLRSYWGASDFERAFIRSGLAASFRDFERASENLDRLAMGDLRSAWAVTHDDRRQLAAVVADALRGAIPDAATSIPLDAGLTGVPASMVALSTDAAHSASDAADESASTLRNSAISQIVVALLCVVASVFAVLLLSRSIVRPLRRLSDQARVVADGTLSVVPLDATGADEVHIAATAFNDLVENLQLAERKVVALGEARLDAPVLGEPLPGRMGSSLQASIENLSQASAEQRRLRDSLEHQATHDPLTGVLNRETALDLLDRIDGTDGPWSVMLLELRNFKAVNDTYGHRVGDEILHQLAQRLLSVMPNDARLARFGGDEFVVIADRDTVEGARSTARMLVSVVGAPFEVTGLTIAVSAHVGVAFGNEDGRDLLAGAIAAAAEARRDQRSGVRLFDEQLHDAQRHRSRLEGWLIEALRSTGRPSGAEGALSLQYQPMIDEHGRKVNAVEALLRMTDPDGAPVRTDQLIEVAERSALILQLGEWVLDEATRQIAEWAEDPRLCELRVSVNASALQLLDPDFPDAVARTIQRHGVRASALMIEVTETAVITDERRVSATLARLRQLGVSIAIDDFGTGYTSIAQLKAFPIDKLKIDKSLVDDVATSEDARALIRVIVELALQLDLSLVAEGVEDLAQFAVLDELGVAVMQGWVFSRSLPPDEIGGFVTAFEQSSTVDSQPSDRRPTV